MRAKSILLIAVALGCGTVASIGISQVINRPKGGQKVETQKIFVAIQDIDIREPLNAQNLQLEEWPKNRIPDGAIVDLEQVEGRFTRQRLYQGEPILEKKLMGKDGAGSPDTLIPDGFRVTSVKVNAASAASGFILPGSRVDVLLFVKKGKEISQTVVKTILRNVRVFGVDQKTERAIDDEGNSIDAKTITLLVSPEQVEKLTLAVAVGSIELSLRPPADESADQKSSEARGETLADLLQGSAPNADPRKGAKQPPGDFLAFLDKQPEPTQAAPEPQSTLNGSRMAIVTPDGVTYYRFDEKSGKPFLVTGDELNQSTPKKKSSKKKSSKKSKSSKEASKKSKSSKEN